MAHGIDVHVLRGLLPDPWNHGQVGAGSGKWHAALCGRERTVVCGPAAPKPFPLSH